MLIQLNCTLFKHRSKFLIQTPSTLKKKYNQEKTTAWHNQTVQTAPQNHQTHLAFILQLKLSDGIPRHSNPLQISSPPQLQTAQVAQPDLLTTSGEPLSDRSKSTPTPSTTIPNSRNASVLAQRRSITRLIIRKTLKSFLHKRGRLRRWVEEEGERKEGTNKDTYERSEKPTIELQ